MKSTGEFLALRYRKRGTSFCWAALVAMATACVPIPVVIGPHLKPVYIGDAPSETGTSCQDSAPYTAISGSQGVRLKVFARMDEAGRALLGLSATAPKGAGMKPFEDSIAVTSLATGKTVAVAPRDAQIFGEGFEYRSATYPLSEGMQSAYRVLLPAITTLRGAWSPGVVELQPVPEHPAFLPFNC